MTTPFDQVIEQIKRRGFHNHRLLEHSDIVSLGILKDLQEQCEPLATDLESGKVKHWLNKSAPGARGRQIDLWIGEPRSDGSPDPAKLRIGIENKSVITAHRNRDARFDDLNESLQVLHRAKPRSGARGHGHRWSRRSGVECARSNFSLSQELRKANPTATLAWRSEIVD